MKKLLFLFLILLFSCATVDTEKKTGEKEQSMSKPAVSLINPETLVGTWEGKIAVGAIQLRMVFHIKLEAGKLSSVVDSPDQGAFGIPVSDVILGEGKKITLEVKATAGSFEGTLESAALMKGDWVQSSQTFPLELKKLAAPIDYSRPQDPKAPYPYQVKEVTFENPGAAITLAGTFTYPVTDKPVTAVILISGSGSQNRNEEIMGHRPFLVLADHLTRQGIAVLRYDDRSVGGSGGDPLTATTADYATDTEAAVAFLKNQEWVKIAKIGLIGHSEGGMIAPLAASHTQDVNFIVLMAGPGYTGREILVQQTRAIMEAMGTNAQEINQALAQNASIYDVLINTANPAEAKAEVEQLLLSLGADKNQASQQAAVLTNPWYVYFLKFDPVPLLKNITIPVLAINGSLDLQVLAKENLAAIDTALKAAGNSRYTIKEFPGLNHLFQTAQTGLMDEYSTIQETIAPAVLEYISSWINGLEKM